MKIFTTLMESLELDKSLDQKLIEDVERYGERPQSGTSKHAKFQKEETPKNEKGTGTNEGGHGTVNPGELPVSGTAKTAKFQKDTRKKTGKDGEVEEVNKEFGDKVTNEEPKEVPSTGKKITESETDEDIKVLDMSIEELNKFDKGHAYKDEDIAEYVRRKLLYHETMLQRHKDRFEALEKKIREKYSLNEGGVVDCCYCDKIIELANQGALSYEGIAKEALKVMCDDDCKELYHILTDEFTDGEVEEFESEKVDEASADLNIGASVDLPDEVVGAAASALLASEETEDEMVPCSRCGVKCFGDKVEADTKEPLCDVCFDDLYYDESQKLDEIGPVAAGLIGAAAGAMLSNNNSKEEAEEPEETEEPIEEVPVEDEPEAEEVEYVEPSKIEIELDEEGNGVNTVEITFEGEHSPEDAEAAIKNFCGDEFFTVLEPVKTETEDGETKYVYEFSAFNRDEDLEAAADNVEEPVEEEPVEEEPVEVEGE